MLKNRFAYLFTLVALFVFIVIYESRMTYFAFYVGLTLPVVSLVLLLISRRRFVLSDKLSKSTIYKNEQVKYIINIKNTSPFPISNAKILFNKDNPALVTDFSEISMPLVQKKTFGFVFNIDAKYRGLYDIGATSLIFYDFLGLFKIRHRLTEFKKLYVTPRPRPIRSHLLLTSTQSGLIADNLAIDEDYSIISDLRQYQSTDGYKKIHWKASARKNELMSKNFQKTKRESAILLLDNSKTSLELEDKMMEVFVSVLNYLTLKQIGIRLFYINSEDTPETNSFDYLYNEANHIPFDSTLSFYDYFSHFSNLKTNADSLLIFIKEITADFMATLYDNLGALSHGSVTIIYFESSIFSQNEEAPALKNLSFIYYKDIIEEEETYAHE